MFLNKSLFKSSKCLAVFLLIIFSLLTTSVYGLNPVKLVELRCEYRENPLGIDNVNPRLSWKMLNASNTRGQKQTAYQVLVASSLKILNKGKGDLWDSGKTPSTQSVNNVYSGKALSSNQQCFWKVRVWDANGKVSAWSAPAKFSMGLLNATDWQGAWILKEDQLKTDHNWYRKNFKLKSKAQSAFVHLGSFGYHELYVNGRKVTENVLNPVSSYMKTRIPYLTYDIAPYLQKGDNVIAVWHAAGWARWRRISEYRNVPFVFKAQVQINTKSQKISFGTDTSWKCKKSYSEYYGDWDILRFGGETIDDSKREDNWNTAEYDDSAWQNAVVYDYKKINAKLPDGHNVSFALNSNNNRTLRAEYGPVTAELSAQMVEPQVKFKELNAVAVKNNNDGTYRIDMGENYTGFFEMNLYNGREGDSILFEISDQTEVVMNWKQKSKYIFGKSGKGIFSNRFNVSAGRWITVYGLKYQPELKDIKGYVITNDRKQISKFESSDTLLNQIYKVNLDTYIANTLDGILMDCPHRERRGWGEVTVAAMYGDALPNFESGAYMDQYAQYMRDTQFADGQIRGVINEEDRPFLMWKANSPITIWETYNTTGDKKFLKDNYDSMLRWMNWMYKASNFETGGALKIGKQGAREMPGLGDWCTPRGNFWDSSNSPEAAHFNNCVYAYMLDCSMKMAQALGKSTDVKMFADRLKVQQKATHALSYDPATGKYLDGRQVNQAFALLTGVTPPEEVAKVTAQLEDNMLYTFPYYDTGSSGQGLYTRYFIEGGERMDLIYELLKDTRHPSYGYFLRQGHTTWPERWSAVGNSQIHTCYTGIGGYFVKGFGGIRPGEKGGMQEFIIKPTPVGDLASANTSYTSLYGDIVVNWKRSGNKASYHIQVPVNSTAKLYLPAVAKENVMEGAVQAENATGVSFVGTEISKAVGNYIVYNLKSGKYNFTVANQPQTTFPDPLQKGGNLATIGRMNASSMHIVTEKDPGFEAFKANDANDSTAWKADGTVNEWLEVEWLKPQTFSRVVIKAENISTYKVQYFNGNNWIDLVTESSFIKSQEHKFKAVSSSKCRLLIVNAKDKPTISEFEIY